MICIRCGLPMEQRNGQAIVISRRQPTDATDAYGQRIDFVPVVQAVIVECLNAFTDCRESRAGALIDGEFHEDLNLIPLSEVWNALMRNREDQENNRGPKSDPGE